MIFIPASLTEASMGDWLNCVAVTEDPGYCEAIFGDDYQAFEDWKAQNRCYDV